MTRELEADQLTDYIANPDNQFAEASTPWLAFLALFLAGFGGGVLISK